MNWAYIAGFCDGEGHIRYEYIALYQRNFVGFLVMSGWLPERAIETIRAT